MEKMMKECTKPHPLLHTASGVGLGLILSGIFGGASFLLGLILLVVGLAGEFVFLK